jgi:hypothetical protein
MEAKEELKVIRKLYKKEQNEVSNLKLSLKDVGAIAKSQIKITEQLKEQLEESKMLLLELSLDCNRVTAMNRHGITSSQKRINELYTTQLKVEKWLNKEES